MDWTVRGSNPVGSKIFFLTEGYRLQNPSSRMHNKYRDFFAGLNWPGSDVDNPFASSVEVKERVELYLYLLCWPSWPVVRRNLQNYTA
jgi:hypothetical protein